MEHGGLFTFLQLLGIDRSLCSFICRQFPGFARKFETWADQALKLQEALDAKKLKYRKDYYYTAGYDSPFTLFNRHNEVWFVAVDEQ